MLRPATFSRGVTNQLCSGLLPPRGSCSLVYRVEFRYNRNSWVMSSTASLLRRSCDIPIVIQEATLGVANDGSIIRITLRVMGKLSRMVRQTISLSSLLSSLPWQGREKSKDHIILIVASHLSRCFWLRQIPRTARSEITAIEHYRSTSLGTANVHITVSAGRATLDCSFTSICVFPNWRTTA